MRKRAANSSLIERALHRILHGMRAAFVQLGFDFFSDTPVIAEVAPTSGPSRTPPNASLNASAPSSPAVSTAPPMPMATLFAAEGVLGSRIEPSRIEPSRTEASRNEPARDRPARGRAAIRARTAVLFSRLQDLGLRGVESLVLMRTRNTMVSLIGRTLRVNEAYADAPESVLRAIVAFAIARNKNERAAARDEILKFEGDRPVVPRRVETPRPGDLALIAQFTEAHRQLNEQHFGGTLTTVPILLSGRMATRLGHYDPGSRHGPAEIVMSRKHVVRHGWREAMHTLLHEMVHQWQHETGVPVDHGQAFRKKAKEVGITPAARRDVVPLERRKQRAGTG